MALETLKDVTEIDGFKVANMDKLKEEFPALVEPSGQLNWEKFEKDVRPTHPIQYRPDKNSISFTLQNGPIKEVGVNGCQVDTLIATALRIIHGLNEKFPCRENSLAETKLAEALHWLDARKRNREKRGVEGTNQA